MRSSHTKYTRLDSKMDNIKIVHMQDGTDIIGMVNEILEGQYVIEEPMMFELMGKGKVLHITLAHYLPVEMVAKNEVIISAKDIVYITNPSENFSTYYKETLMRMDDSVDESMLKEMNESLEEKIKEIIVQNFEDMDIPGEKILH